MNLLSALLNTQQCLDGIPIRKQIKYLKLNLITRNTQFVITK